MGLYARGIQTEIECALEAYPALRGRPICSVYFGGGTPSLLHPDHVAAILARLRSAFPATPDATYPDFEVTLECNPARTEMEHLEAMQRAGVNRISLGVQSFRDKSLHALGRAHDSDDARRAIDHIRATGFPSWGLDLIFGVPDSRENDFHRDLEEAASHTPPHISVYGLTLHEGTPMQAAWLRGEIKTPDEESQRAMFLDAREYLTRHGWEHYEISNYALPGHRARHNTLYWQDAPYLGLGPSAHSYIAGVRYANPPDVEAWQEKLETKRLPAEPEEPPCARARRAEHIMLALRQVEGVSLKALNRRIGCDFIRNYPLEMAEMQKRGLLSVQAGRLALTEEGLLLSDTVFEAFF